LSELPEKIDFTLIARAQLVGGEEQRPTAGQVLPLARPFDRPCASTGEV
jgi:hypothetical protein